MSSKKWLVGCGGCLVALFLGTIVIAAIAFFAAKGYFDSAQKMGSALYHGKAPENTIALLGMDLKDENSTFALSLVPNSKTVLIALKTPLDAEAAKVINSGNIQPLEGMANQFMQTSETANENDITLSLQSVKQVTLADGKPHPVIWANLMVQSKARMVPLVVTLFPETDGKVLFLMALQGQLPNEAAFDSLTQTLQQTVASSGLATAKPVTETSDSKIHPIRAAVTVQ